MWELVHSQHVIRNRVGDAVFAPWRRQVANTRPGRWQALLTLAPAWGYTPDFLTPTLGSVDLDAGIDDVLRTPRQALSRDLGRLAGDRALPGWAGDLARGDVTKLHSLGCLMRCYFDTLLAPHWPRMRRTVDQELHRLAQTMARCGIEGMLTEASPVLRWDSPVLELVTKSVDGDVHLRGRGLILQPSFFAFADVNRVDLPGMPMVLTIPVRHTLGWWSDDRVDASSGQQRLAALLGGTRARALELLAEQKCSTTQLAIQLGLSLAAASQAAKVLREAGLISSAAQGKKVMHEASALGVQVLEGGARI